MSPIIDDLPPTHSGRDGRKHLPDVRNMPSSLEEFVIWLVNAGEISRITSRRLRALYGEFCIFTETPSLSTGRLFRRLKAAGINRYREGAAERRWLYEVRTCRKNSVKGFTASVSRDENE